MRTLFTFMCVLALGVMGCGETAGTGGSGGTAGTGGEAGTGGTGGDGGQGGMPECEVDRDCFTSNECVANGGASCVDGMCAFTPIGDGTACDKRNQCTVGRCANITCESTTVQDGTTCADGAGTCEVGSCVGTFACTEQGIRDAIAVGGGPHTFDCDGMTEVKTLRQINIANDVILDGEGNLTVDGTRRVFFVFEGVTVELNGFTVTGGVATESGDGGGIENYGTLALTNTRVSGNAAESGGGISNSGTLTLTNSTVSGNDAISEGGGIWNVGTLTVTNSTVTENVAHGCKPLCGAGGIWNVGTLTMTNSTVSGNTRGGIWNLFDGMTTVVNSTISGNSGDDIVNLVADQGGVLTLRGNLVEGQCILVGPLTGSNGYNIESPGDTCGFDQSTDQVSVSADDLKLGELADNGGPTETHALLPGSPAINQIPQADCLDADGEPLTTDQRGMTRPQGDACDVGAFELEMTP